MEYPKIENLPEDNVIGKQYIPEKALIDPDEPCLSFMNSKTRAELPDLPNTAVVITEELQDDAILVVPQREFDDWLMENAE